MAATTRTDRERDRDRDNADSTQNDKTHKEPTERGARMTGRGGWYARQDWARQERQARREAQQHGMNDSRTSLMLGMLGGVAAVVIFVMWAAR